MTYHSVSDYLKALEKWQQIPAKICAGKMTLFIKNKWVTKKEFDAHNSRPMYAPKVSEFAGGIFVFGGVISKK